MTSNESKVAWVSRAIDDTRLVKRFANELAESNPERSLALTKKLARGKARTSDEFPRKYFYKYKDTSPRSLPDFMQSSGYFFVSDRLRDALQTGDMGSTSFIPIELYKYDRERRIELSYSLIVFSEIKNTVVLENSRYRKGPYKGNLPELHVDSKDGDLTLSEQALHGTDLWIEESFSGAFFFSDRLVQTLRAEKLTRRLSLRRCKIAAERATHAQG